MKKITGRAEDIYAFLSHCSWSIRTLKIIKYLLFVIVWGRGSRITYILVNRITAYSVFPSMPWLASRIPVVVVFFNIRIILCSNVLIT